MELQQEQSAAHDSTRLTGRQDAVSHSYSTPHSRWRCPMCDLRSAQTAPDAIFRHFNSVHKPEDAMEARKAASDPETYWHQQWQEAHLRAGQASPTGGDQQRQPTPRRPVKQASFGTEFNEGVQRMRIHGSTTPASQVHGYTSANHSTMDDISQAATMGRHHSASPASKLRQGSHRSRPSSGQDFKQHTRQSREASRDINAPTSEAHDEARRKRHSTNSQTASTASATSPRPQVQPPRYKGPFPTHSTKSCWPDLILQPESREITEEQLAAEVRAIYQVLTALESKCIEYDKQYAVASQKGPLPANTWRALIGMHRRLLNDHHDFFLASQHPSASPPLHKLATKYNMAARMWKHGIHVFLELLRHQLPHSIEFMISFIYMAYQMVSLLLETVPSFKETWIECLGDLSRYRMAVEEEDMRDREQWGMVARYWYSQASDSLPTTGRLYHHLAILARPDALQQNHLFAKSLIAVQPFLSARESIQTLYDPVIKNESTYINEIDALFVKTSGYNFYRRFDLVATAQIPLMEKLAGHIGDCGDKWAPMGVYVASVTIATVFEYGNQSLMFHACDAGNRGIKAAQSTDKPTDESSTDADAKQQIKTQDDAESERAIAMAEAFFFQTMNIVLARKSEKNTYLYTHVVLAFILSLASYDEHLQNAPRLQTRVRRFLAKVPWSAISHYLNALPQSSNSDSTIMTSDFPRPVKGEQGRLQEDFALRGMLFTAHYFPEDWFDGISADDDRMMEPASMSSIRIHRLRWLGYKLAEYECLSFDQTLGTWAANPAFPWADYDVQYQSSAAVHVDMGDRSDTQSFDKRTAAIGALQKGMTTLVIDNKLVPENMDILKHLATSGWEILIPVNIWHKLRELSEKENGVYSDTVAAVERSTAKIVDAKGNPELSPPSASACTPPHTESDCTSMDEDGDDFVMVKFTKRASDKAVAQSAANTRPTEYAIITDTEAVIRHAKELNVPHVTSADVRAVFMHGHERVKEECDDAMEYSVP